MTEKVATLLDQLLVELIKDSPMQADALRRTVEKLTDEEREDLADYVHLCVDNGVGLGRLSEAYRTISMDTLREQIHFRRHGSYRHSTFAEVADQVYFDPGYMSNYMYGLALTQFLWPNHLEIYRFFKASLARAGAGRYLEVGPGHGAYFRLALRSGRFEHCLGVDISPTSLQQTRQLLASEPAGGVPWELVESDFLDLPVPVTPFGAVVMGEVLEHVEDPAAFLRKTFALAGPGSFVFVTTAVNAPAVDHIYLYRSVGEVESMARDAGFTVVETLATPYPGRTMEQTVDDRLPINVALVLGK